MAGKVQSVRTDEFLVATTNQVSVSASANTLIVAANPKRRSVLITNITGSQVIYIGFRNEVLTTSVGAYLHSAAGSSLTVFAKGDVWGIAVSGAQTVSYLEESYTDLATG